MSFRGSRFPSASKFGKIRVFVSLFVEAGGGENEVIEYKWEKKPTSEMYTNRKIKNIQSTPLHTDHANI